MILDYIMAGIEVKDYEFDDALYPESINNLSATHFTPIDVCVQAAQFLVTAPGTKVLDIGSGAGKFCMVGAASTAGHFTGIEQRLGLHQVAEKIAKKRQLPNIEFIHSNIIEIDFNQYQAFYFYNSFYENMVPIDKIDNDFVLNAQLYKVYSEYVRHQLDLMPVGTRLVTYFSSYDEVPKSYKALKKIEIKKLTFWEKQEDKHAE